VLLGLPTAPTPTVDDLTGVAIEPTVAGVPATEVALALLGVAGTTGVVVATLGAAGLEA
jgi:hypothetical protein